MSVWQHISGMDHLRRHAEGQIEEARRSQKASPAAGGKHALSGHAAKLNCLQSVGCAPALSDISDDSFGGK
ncbi:MAG: hypothetical protein JKY92_06975 [Magnetovibrio sp.]|nr:hypothetical protein [Magnetovibrio sp.]